MLINKAFLSPVQLLALVEKTLNGYVLPRPRLHSE
jgi:hypothetical protein